MRHHLALDIGGNKASSSSSQNVRSSCNSTGAQAGGAEPSIIAE